MPSETLKVLRQALELGTFTIPELSAISGVGYETVKKTLRDELDKTVAKTGEKAKASVGRPSDIWIVIDRDAIVARLGRMAEAAHEVTALVEELARSDSPEADLEAAEDHLVVALSAEDGEDAASVGREALAALAAYRPLEAASHPPNSLGSPRNLTKREGRARVVEAVSNYVISSEAEGLRGLLWRAAFDAVASFDNPEQYAMHKFFITRLVQRAAQRSEAARGLTEFTQDQVTELVYAGLSERTPDGPALDLIALDGSQSAAGRESIRGAVIQLVAAASERSRPFTEAVVTDLLRTASRLFAPGKATSLEDRQDLVDHLSRFALSTRETVARLAQETLVTLHEPKQPTYWLDLASSAPVRPEIRLVFQGLSHSNVALAFAFLRQALAAGQSVDETRHVLVESLPRMSALYGDIVEEAFANFLSSLPDEEHRRRLAATPELAGLDWPVVSFERRLIPQFFAKVSRWKVLLRDEDSEDISQQRAALAHDILQLAPRVFPLFGQNDEQRACETLTTELYVPAGAALAVDTLLSVGRESQLARHLQDNKAPDDSLWHSLVSWYMDIVPRSRLDHQHRMRLVAALYRSLPRHQGESFLIGVMRATDDDLPLEVIDNPHIEPNLRLQLEQWWSNSYRNFPTDLETFAEEADFMEMGVR